MNDNYQHYDATNLNRKLTRDVSNKFRIIQKAKKLSDRLNVEIEKGNDRAAFMIALFLAGLKDFLDIILSIFLIGLVPGISFSIGLFLTTFLFFFMLGKGWFLKFKLRILFLTLGLFFDSIPVFNTLPTNVLLVLYAWRTVKKRAAEAELELKEINSSLEFVNSTQ